MTPGARLKAARLIQSALPGYYEAMGLEGADAVVTSEFGASGCELENCDAFIDAGAVLGVLCTYPMTELAERQYRSVQLVARTLSGDQYRSFAANLRDLRSGLPAVEGDGTYLAFIAVAAEAKGSGLANRVMNTAISSAGEGPLLLTVRNDNARAQAFYARHGFAVAAKGERFSLLRRDGNPDGLTATA
ncbi:GNAT family N-acetyltransferase [Sphingomonas glaciei]|uniref:GNAT family N-acetyltransferase n=1 Tax=Sphingomonas glaciei TaxID=2938948 RepID=A0ABY5MSM3_9SPHN|nr:GNAT family N-acetyltransferase [Sphingomonas glaciei]UUR06944.1 GNAT family N-acetyltransferase [Sphingomonas glaciei]